MTREDGYSIRRVTESDFPTLTAMTKRSFGKDIDPNYFQWKFGDNPSGKVVGLLAESPEGEAAAFYGLMPMKFILHGEEQTVYQACNGMTDPDHQKKGLFRFLHQAGDTFLNEEKKTLGISYSGPITVRIKFDYGWQQVTTLLFYFTPKIKSYFYSSKVNPKVNQVTDLNSISELLKLSSDGLNIHPLKSAKTYQWRLSNPEIDYKVIALQDGKNAGFCTYHIQQNKILLFDFFFTNKKAGRILVKHLQQKVRKDGLKGIATLVQEKTRRSKILQRLGFIRNPFSFGPLTRKIPFTISIPNKENTSYLESANWGLTSFEYDAD